MKLLLPTWLLLGLLTAASSCKKDSHEPDLNLAICPDGISCPDAGEVVKTVADVRGIVRLNPVTQQYAIATYPTITNSFDVGVLCAVLPTDFRADGTKVVFSGTYRTKPGEPTGGDVAIYYLSPSKVSLDPAP